MIFVKSTSFKTISIESPGYTSIVIEAKNVVVSEVVHQSQLYQKIFNG